MLQTAVIPEQHQEQPWEGWAVVLMLTLPLLGSGGLSSVPLSVLFG